MLLVGNGKTLSFIDYDVGQKSSWPVAKSPLAVLLSANPTSAGSPASCRRTIRVGRRGPRARCPPARVRHAGAGVHARRRAGGLTLEGWTAIDAQNKTTKVRLDGQRYNVAVAESAFTYAEPKRKR
jgi:outer membrane lipoprotein-sorting protein